MTCEGYNQCTGAAISAAICGYLVTCKIQAYADVLRKASENLDSRNKQKEEDGQEKAKPPKSAPEHEALVRPRSTWLNHMQDLQFTCARPPYALTAETPITVKPKY